eukprot:1158799-Pelagomonas_calceolata.AAC.1
MMPSQCATLVTPSNNPLHDDESMLQLLRHALHSSIHPIAFANAILLFHWRGSSGNAYMNWINNLLDS